MPSITIEMKLPISVVTYDGEEVVNEVVIDYGTHAGRVRISKHITWAINNSYTVEMEPVV